MRNDFANVTLFTPKYVTLTATDVSSGYEAIYNITTPSSQTSGVILTFGITSLGTISNVTFKGLWTGVNYTQLDYWLPDPKHCKQCLRSLHPVAPGSRKWR